MGLPAKLLADGERPLVVLRPHIRRLLRPAVFLLLVAPVTSFAIAAVPAGPGQLPARLVVAGVALMVALHWVVFPFLLWWNTQYVLTDQRLLERQGVARRAGHDLPLRAVSDVVVAQRFAERVLRCGTLTVTTDGGAELEVTDVPAVQRLRRSLLVVADDIAERLRIVREERWQDHVAGLSQDVAADGAGDDGWEAHDWAGWDDDDDEPEADGPSRREVRRRGRETTRRLKALQAEVRRAPPPDSPVEDDGLDGGLGDASAGNGTAAAGVHRRPCRPSGAAIRPSPVPFDPACRRAPSRRRRPARTPSRMSRTRSTTTAWTNPRCGDARILRFPGRP